MNQFRVRTDLAVEARDYIMDSKEELRGIRVEEVQSGDIHTTEVYIESKNASKAMGKPMGTYLTLDLPQLPRDREEILKTARAVAAMLEELPEGAVSIGTLHFIGQDRIPRKDLETNCLCDNHAYSLEEREVFANPDDPDHIYVYSVHYWSGGSYGEYWECPLWTAT